MCPVAGCLWLTNNSFLWTANLSKPLYEVKVSVTKGLITLKTLLNKSGHCRLTVGGITQEEATNIKYSGNKRARYFSFSKKMYSQNYIFLLKNFRLFLCQPGLARSVLLPDQLPHGKKRGTKKTG